MAEDRTTSKQVIGARLKQAAQEAGLDAADIGAAMGISAQTVYNWWSGKRQPDLVDLQQYAEVAHKEPGWFFDPDGKRTERVDDLLVRILTLTVEGTDFGKAYERVMDGRGRLSPRERRMVSAGTEALRSRVRQQEEWDALSPEERLRVLRQIVSEAHREA
jgi:transcriptional regulator with XRE-family HTH domain